MMHVSCPSNKDSIDMHRYLIFAVALTCITMPALTNDTIFLPSDSDRGYSTLIMNIANPQVYAPYSDVGNRVNGDCRGTCRGRWGAVNPYVGVPVPGPYSGVGNRVNGDCRGTCKGR